MGTAVVEEEAEEVIGSKWSLLLYTILSEFR